MGEVNGDTKGKTYDDLVKWLDTGDSEDLATLCLLLKQTRTGALFQLAGRFGFGHYNAERNSRIRAQRWVTLLEEAGNEIDRRFTELEERQSNLERQRRIAAPILGE